MKHRKELKYLFITADTSMASKCKRPKLLPDPRQLLQQQKEEMNTIKALNGSIHMLKNSNLFLLGETAQQNVPEATKVVWLVTK